MPTNKHLPTPKPLATTTLQTLPKNHQKLPTNPNHKIQNDTRTAKKHANTRRKPTHRPLLHLPKLHRNPTKRYRRNHPKYDKNQTLN